MVDDDDGTCDERPAPTDIDVIYRCSFPVSCVRAYFLSFFFFNFLLCLSPPNSNFRMNREFSSIVLIDFLGQNELLVLQNPWESVKDCLPDVLDRKQYGV